MNKKQGKKYVMIMEAGKIFVSMVTITFASVGCNKAFAVTNLAGDSITPESVVAPQPLETPSVWTFDDCISWALNNNTDLRRTMLNILSARQDILSAKDSWLPTVDFSTNHTYTNYPVKEEGQNGNIYSSSYNIGAAWTVWEGNVRTYRAETAKLLERQQELNGDDIVKTLKLGILEAYINIISGDEAVKIAEQTLQVSTSQAKRAQRLMEAGRMSRVEYAQLESQRAQDEYNLTIARSNYDNSKLALKKILALGLNYDLNVETLHISDAQLLNSLPDRTEVYELAVQWLPQFKNNRISKNIYKNEVKIAKAGRLPTISLQGNIGTGYATGSNYGWGKSMSHNLNEYIGVSVKVPIFDGNTTKRAVAKARLAELEYDITQKELLDNLSQTLESVYLSATNAQAKYKAGLAQLEAVKLTDELVNRQFELGYVNPLELLTAHNNLLNARLELLQSKYLALLGIKTIEFYANEHVELK